MDVVSDKKVTRLAATEGKTRVYELQDRNWLKAADGTVAWRNNNPGNLKFEYTGSADSTVHTHLTKEKALEAAQSRYDGDGPRPMGQCGIRKLRSQPRGAEGPAARTHAGQGHRGTDQELFQGRLQLQDAPRVAGEDQLRHGVGARRRSTWQDGRQRDRQGAHRGRPVPRERLEARHRGEDLAAFPGEAATHPCTPMPPKRHRARRHRTARRRLRTPPRPRMGHRTPDTLPGPPRMAISMSIGKAITASMSAICSATWRRSRHRPSRPSSRRRNRHPSRPTRRRA